MQGVFIPWIIWTLSFLLFNIASLVSAILSLCLKGKARMDAVDRLLCSATLVLVVGYSVVFLPPPESPHDKARGAINAFQLSYVRQADLTGQALAMAYDVESLADPLKAMARSDGVPSWKAQLERAEGWLQKVAESNPSDPALTARLAIVVHENGGDTKKLFQDYVRAGGASTSLLDALSSIYSSQSGQSQPGGDGTTKGTDTAIKEGLPNGWYQDSALLSAYKITSPHDMQALADQRESHVRQWQIKYGIYQLLRVSSCLIFLLALIVSLLSRKRTKALPPDPVNYGFRKTYGCLVSLLYAQFLAGFLCGFLLSYAVGLKLAKFESGGFSIITMTLSILAGVAAAVCCVYFFVCKPARISLGAWWQGDRPLTLTKLAYVVIVGFCSTVGVNCLVRFLSGLIPGAPRGSGNEVQLHMSDALASADVGLIVWYTLVAVILAPIVEESLFRGLLYTWLRQHTGVVLAAIITSVAFAAFHFDPRGAVQYFGVGLVLAIAYERTRSLPAVACIHALWNTWVLAMMSVLMP